MALKKNRRSGSYNIEEMLVETGIFYSEKKYFNKKINLSEFFSHNKYGLPIAYQK